MQSKPRLTYANIVSTLALFLVLGSSAAYAADKIRSGDIAPGAVRTSDVFKRAIVSGKIAVGAVRSNQIADGAVGRSRSGPARSLPRTSSSRFSSSSAPPAAPHP